MAAKTRMENGGTIMYEKNIEYNGLYTKAVKKNHKKFRKHKPESLSPKQEIKLNL